MGRGSECCRVSHVRPTYSLAPKGSRAAGPRGQPETPLAGGGGRGTQTTPPRLRSLLWAFSWWDRLGRSPIPVLGPRRVWVLWLGEGAGAFSGLPMGPWVHGSICLLAGRCAPLHPILYPGPTLLCRGCFPLPVFFPALAPPRAAWSGGGGGAPQEAGVFFLYHCPSLPTPIVLLK